MSEHLTGQPACPHLPPVASPLRASAMKALVGDRGPRFYLQALKCAQSLWCQGLPGQAILMVNRAFAADLAGDEPELIDWPLPYRAMRWIMSNRLEDQFIGNPRRHFQHLATRMVEPRRDLRTWRAWGCWHLACRCLPDMPADRQQLLDEAIQEPSDELIFENLRRIGLPGEAELWREVAIPASRG